MNQTTSFLIGGVLVSIEKLKVLSTMKHIPPDEVNLPIEAIALKVGFVFAEVGEHVPIVKRLNEISMWLHIAHGILSFSGAMYFVIKGWHLHYFMQLIEIHTQDLLLKS